MSCLVSVVLPTHNRAELLPRAIDSVISQTYDHFELIIVDDGSTDKTADVVGRYEDPRVTLIRLAENQGAPGARNIGIRSSTGEFIAFLDSDDEWYPTKLEKQVNLIESAPALVGAVGSGREIRIDQDQGTTARFRIPRPDIGNIYRALLSGRAFPGTPFWPGGTPAIMFRAECLETVGLFDESLPAAQEHDLYIRFSEHYDFVAVAEPLVIIHFDAVSRISTDPSGQIEGKMKFLEKYSDRFPTFSVLKANFSYHLGILLLLDGQTALGRKYLFQAVRSYPLSTRYWYHFFRAWTCF